MKGRKGQAAMEYLMTYGWAILIVIIVVAALWAMGVFTVSAPVACSPCFSYFAFVDYADGTLVMRNGPQDISINSVTGGTLTGTFTPGEQMTMTGISTSGDVSLTINYTVTRSGLDHTDTATIHN